MTVPSPYAELLDRIPMRRREVDTASGRTVFWDYGPDDAAHTIVAVHGFRGDHHGLEAIVAHLPDARVLSPDLPGFGATSPLEGRAHDLDGYARWLTDFVETVAPGCILLGHSFGSIVASAAVAGSLAVPRLILINPIGAPALEGPRGVLTRLAIGYYEAGRRLPERLGTSLLRDRRVVRLMSEAMTKTRDRALRAWIHDQHDRFFSGFSDRRVLAEAFRTSVSHDIRRFAPRVTVPTLLIAAVQDDITPIEAERDLVEMFPDARLVEIDRVGHLIHYEKPDRAAQAIRAFLAEG